MKLKPEKFQNLTQEIGVAVLTHIAWAAISTFVSRVFSGPQLQKVAYQCHASRFIINAFFGAGMAKIQFKMKKLLVTTIMVLSFVLGAAQDLVYFELQPNGSYLTQKGESSVVLRFDGKSAQELYSMCKSNAILLYNSSKHVLSENENVTMKIRAVGQVAIKNILFIPRIFEGYYTLCFHFKDGRIKVDAPIVEDKLYDAQNLLQSYNIPTFSDYVKGIFNKKGQVKKNKETQKGMAELDVNKAINFILSDNQEEDW